MGFEPQDISPMETVNDFVDRVQQAESEAKAALTKAKNKQARYYNRRRTPAPTFKPGDKVWLDSSDIPTTRPSKKLSHPWIGPYPIIKAVPPMSYKLKLPTSLTRLHPVFPVVKLHPYLDDPISGRKPAPPPDPQLVDGYMQYTVEKILNSKMVRGKLKYQVQWTGYNDPTWEPAETIEKDIPKLVEEFHSRHPNAPRHINSTTFQSLHFRRYTNYTSGSVHRDDAP